MAILKYRVAGLVLGFVGLALLVIGSMVVGFGNKLIRQKIVSMESLSSASTRDFKAWISNVGSSAPTYKEFYLFNVTNPDEVLQGAKPVLEQVGPYVYVANTVHFNYSWLEGGNKLQYKSWNYYEFQPDLSNGLSDEDVVINTNIAIQLIWGLTNNDLLSALEIFNYLNQTTNGYSTKLFVNLTVKEWLWGYEDPSLAAIEILFPTIPSRYPGLGENTTNETLADATGFSGMYTGADDVDLLQTFYLYQGKYNLTYWGTPEANQISGTGGVQFHPGVASDEKLAFFNPAIVRTVLMEPVNEDENVLGVKTIRYEEPQSLYYNAETYPPNAAYYQYGPNGLINMSAAIDNLQLYVTKPHFLDADQSLLNGVIGLHPNSTLHRTFIDVEPITGATVAAAYRTQVVFKLTPFNFTSAVWFENLTSVYLPMLWAEEHGMLTSADADMIKTDIYGTQQKLVAAKWAMIAIGIVLCIAAIIVYTRSVVSYKILKMQLEKLSESLSSGKKIVEISNSRTDHLEEVTGVRRQSFEIAADEETRLLASKNVPQPPAERYGALSAK